MDIIKIDNAECILCESYLDRKGDHGINCQHGHGRHGTHNSMSAGVMRLCEEAGYACDLELNGLIEDTSKRPADVFVHSFYGDVSLALDLGITSHFRDQQSSNRQILINKSIEDRNHIPKLYYENKIKKI